MAAKQLDTVWDESVAGLSGSYEKATALLAKKQVKEAQDEFRAQAIPAVKKIFSEAATTYPERFKKIGDWCEWIKDMYMTAARADKALGSGQADEAAKLLASLRKQFYDLHQQTDTVKVNDLIYAFRAEAAKDKPSAAELKKLRNAVDQAEPSVKAKKEATAFMQARMAWAAVIDPILADGKIDGGEIKALRDASDVFYAAYGMQLE